MKTKLKSNAKDSGEKNVVIKTGSYMMKTEITEE